MQSMQHTLSARFPNRLCFLLSPAKFWHAVPPCWHIVDALGSSSMCAGDVSDWACADFLAGEYHPGDGLYGAGHAVGAAAAEEPAGRVHLPVVPEVLHCPWMPDTCSWSMLPEPDMNS
jgi:hypothetical protein